MADAVSKATFDDGDGENRQVAVWTTEDGLTVITGCENSVMAHDVNGVDLLQQAINEVSHGLSRSEAILYAPDNSMLSFEHIGGVPPPLAVLSQADDACMDGVNTVVDISNACLQAVQGGTFTYVTADLGGDLSTLSNMVTESSDTAGDNSFANIGGDPNASSLSHQSQELLHNKTSDSPDTVDDVVKLSSNTVADESAPLGSSKNPIRIIQRGNEFTSMQHLSSDQLTQILQVIQQQQLLQPTKQSPAGSTVLYNPESQTRVVYRVLGPNTVSSVSEHASGGAKVVVRSVRDQNSKRVYRKRKKEDEDRLDGIELSRQEKEERKKHRPRTRSGRVSRPPQYMVKDYKHIHPVDYDEDYDDSDGGYSDFKPSSDEDDFDERQSKDNSFVDYELSSGGRLKQNKCATCDKKYIGRGGLARHYRLNPTHGTMPDELPGTEGTSGEAPMVDYMADATPEMCGENSVSEVQPDNGTSFSFKEFRHEAVNSNTEFSLATLNPHFVPVKKRRRGRPPVNQQVDRRKARLAELVQQCTVNELIDVAMPRIVSSTSLWQYLMAKCDLCGVGQMNALDRKSQIVDLLCRYNDFRCQLKTICQKKLSRTDEPSISSESELQISSECSGVQSDCIQITDAVASCLMLQAGQYKVNGKIPIPCSSTEHSFEEPAASDQSQTVPVIASYEQTEELSSCFSEHDSSGIPKQLDISTEAAEKLLSYQGDCTQSGYDNTGVENAEVPSFAFSQCGNSCEIVVGCALTLTSDEICEKSQNTATLPASSFSLHAAGASSSINCDQPHLPEPDSLTTTSQDNVPHLSKLSNGSPDERVPLATDSFVSSNGIGFELDEQSVISNQDISCLTMFYSGSDRDASSVQTASCSHKLNVANAAAEVAADETGHERGADSIAEVCDDSNSMNNSENPVSQMDVVDDYFVNAGDRCFTRHS